MGAKMVGGKQSRLQRPRRRNLTHLIFLTMMMPNFGAVAVVGICVRRRGLLPDAVFLMLIAGWVLSCCPEYRRQNSIVLTEIQRLGWEPDDLTVAG